MKFLEKIALVLYSCIMLILSIIVCLLIFGWLDVDLVANVIHKLIIGDLSGKVLLGFSIAFILLSIKCIFFDSKSGGRSKSTQGILLENENGKLLISKETMENLVNTVVMKARGAKTVTTKVELDSQNNVIISVNMVVGSETIIKELSAKLQNEIKEKIKKSTDLEVKEVNITIKKVAPEEVIEE